MDLSKQIFKAFKSKGLTITAQASKAVNQVLSQEQEPESALYLVLDEIRDRIEKREIKSSVIDVDVIKAVVADLSSSEEDLSKEKFQLMDAFSAPKIDYDENQKSYKLVIKPTYSIHGNVHSRANMYRERLNFTLQWLLRSGSFVLGGLSTTRSLPPDVHEITTVTSLLGSTKTRVLFGMITQVCMYIYVYM
jgi:hypothetical protein